MVDRALVFTDIVDSTRQVERLGDDAAAELWARHDRAARDLLRANDGLEIDRSDGFFALFDDVADAARFVLDYHVVLSGMALQARAAVHVGRVGLRRNSPDDVLRGAKPIEVDGLAKPFAARLLLLCGPGQTLVSDSAAASLRGSPPSPAVIASHGHYRLKGVAEPIEVFGLAAAATALMPPPDVDKAYRVVRRDAAWVPLRAVPHNLVPERDAFVGRGDELRRLADRFTAGARLVALIGPAGCGKTRLARRFARTWLGDYPGGVLFCDLSEARSLDGVCFAVASALEVPLAGADAVQQLGHAIAGRGRCLLILDNFEQVLDCAGASLGAWLDRADDASFVVTSRERLQIGGEQVFVLEPLRLADEAPELFAVRARNHRPGFSLDGAQGRAVAEVVRLLDGLPLAIELAAARTRVLSPAQIIERLRDRFALLAQRNPERSRQATLRAAIDWSWELLEPWEQDALAQCAVFEGGFTLEAAEAVIDPAPRAEAPPVVDVVQALVDKSLLRVWLPDNGKRSGSQELRFGMYISIHEYAAEKLRQAGSSRLDVERRHGRVFAEMGSDASIEQLSVHGGERARQRFKADVENLVVACRRAVTRSDAEVATKTYRAAWEVLDLQGPCSLGVALGDVVLGMPGLEGAALAGARLTRAQAARRVGRSAEAERLLEQALAGAALARAAALHASVLGHLANVRFQRGAVEQALVLHRQVLEAHRAAGRRRNEGLVRNNIGSLHLDGGRIDEARAEYTAALAINREVGNRDAEGLVLANLATLEEDQGRFEAALSCYDEALVIHREVGNRQAEGLTLSNLAGLRYTIGDLAGARQTLESALALQRECGARQHQTGTVAQLGMVEQDEGRLDEADARYREAMAIALEASDRRGEAFVLAYMSDLLAERGRDVEAAEGFARSVAIFRELKERTLLGQILCLKGRRDAAAGRLAAARRALEEGQAIALEVGAGPTSDLGRRIAALRALFGHPAPQAP